jgi:Recombinase
VWEILRNPKYTGYQVWNRRARKRGDKTNPPEQWIWSEEPAHEVLVSRGDVRGGRPPLGLPRQSHEGRGGSCRLRATDLSAEVLPPLRGVRSADARTRTPRGVLLRLRDRALPATLVAPEHPKMIYLREDRAVARVIEFLQTHLFGPGRREGLARAMEENDPERDGHHDEAERLKSELVELAARIRRQVSHLEAPGGRYRRRR